MLKTNPVSSSTPDRSVMGNTINVIFGNPIDQDLDVLALKYANGLYGTDLAVTDILGIRSYSLGHGEYEFIETRGAINATQVLMQEVGPLHHFEYEQIKIFAHNAVTLCLTKYPDAKTLGIPFHGIAAGLDELAAVSSLIQGLEDGFRTAQSNELSIVIIESNATRAERAQQFLDSMNSFLRAIPAGPAVPKRREPITPAQNFTQARAETINHDRRLFCAMPFNEEYMDHWDLAVQPAAHDNDLIVERVDHGSFTGDILDEIKRRIERSTAVIALLDNRNPNVFLEVGYAWGKGIPTILIMHEDSNMPFDVRGQKILRYQRLGELKGMLTQEIKDLFV